MTYTEYERRANDIDAWAKAQEYERRANDIDAWAKAQYDNGKHSEQLIEAQVERMYDKLDDEYMPSRHSGFHGGQYIADFIEE